MDCKHVDALLMDYLYQELDPTQAEHVEAHLQVCTRCAGELSAYERTRATVRGLPELEPPSSIDELLLREATKAVRLQPEPAPGFWQRVRESLRVMVLHPAMTAAVTLVLVLGVSFYIYRSSAPPSSGPLIEPTPAPVETASTEKPEGAVAKPVSPAVTAPQVAASARGEKAQDRTDEKLAELEARLARDQAESQAVGGLSRQAGRRAVSRELMPKSTAAGPAVRASTGTPYGNDTGGFGKGGSAGMAAKPRAAERANPWSSPRRRPRPRRRSRPGRPRRPRPRRSRSTRRPSRPAMVSTTSSWLTRTRSPTSARRGQDEARAGRGRGGQAGPRRRVSSQAGKGQEGKELSAEQWMRQGMIARSWASAARRWFTTTGRSPSTEARRQALQRSERLRGHAQRDRTRRRQAGEPAPLRHAGSGGVRAGRGCASSTPSR